MGAVTRSGLISLGYFAIRSTVEVITKATEDVNVAIGKAFPNGGWWASVRVDGLAGGRGLTLNGVRTKGTCALGRTSTLMGRVAAAGFSTSMSISIHLNISPHGTGRVIENIISLPRKANGRIQILTLYAPSGRTRTATTNTSCIKLSRCVRGVGNN